MYEGTFNEEKFAQTVGQFYSANEYLAHATFELGVTLKDQGAAEQMAQQANESLKNCLALAGPELGFLKPKIHARGSKLLIGTQMCIPDRALSANARVLKTSKVPDELQQVFAHIDQHVRWEVQLATSVGEVYDSKRSVAEHLAS